MLDGEEKIPMGMCAGCSKRALCRHLCPEAEAYANQDQVSLQELTVGRPVFEKNWQGSSRLPKKFTKKQGDLLSLIVQGKSKLQICRILKVSHSEYHRLMNRMHDKYHNLT